MVLTERTCDFVHLYNKEFTFRFISQVATMLHVQYMRKRDQEVLYSRSSDLENLDSMNIHRWFPWQPSRQCAISKGVEKVYILIHSISIKTCPIFFYEVLTSFTQTNGRMILSGTTIVSVISFIMHDEFILHKIITI